MNDPDEQPRSFPERVARAIQPLLAGVALDLVDLATFGPLGLSAGLALGGIAGWVLAPQWLVPGSATSGLGRWLCALLGAIYCALPGTSVLPLASVLGVVLSMTDESAAQDGSPLSREPRKRHPEAIDVDYRVPDDDESAGR